MTCMSTRPSPAPVVALEDLRGGQLHGVLAQRRGGVGRGAGEVRRGAVEHEPGRLVVDVGDATARSPLQEHVGEPRLLLGDRTRRRARPAPARRGRAPTPGRSGRLGQVREGVHRQSGQASRHTMRVVTLQERTPMSDGPRQRPARHARQEQHPARPLRRPLRRTHAGDDGLGDPRAVLGGQPARGGEPRRRDAEHLGTPARRGEQRDQRPDRAPTARPRCSTAPARATRRCASRSAR